MPRVEDVAAEVQSQLAARRLEETVKPGDRDAGDEKLCWPGDVRTFRREGLRHHDAKEPGRKPQGIQDRLGITSAQGRRPRRDLHGLPRRQQSRSSLPEGCFA